MTTTALPTDPTQLPCGPDRTEVSALHLSITQRWDSGSSHNVHLIENGDIGVILGRGQKDRPLAQPIPTADVEGHVVVALGVDEDHDEVHFRGLSSMGTSEEVIGQAIETLVACRDALSRVRQA